MTANPCNGICLTAGDIGLGDWAGWTTMAYPHPDCPLHGNPTGDPPLTPEEEEMVESDATVCVVHLKFIPCRPCDKDPQHHSTDPVDVEFVRQHQQEK